MIRTICYSIALFTATSLYGMQYTVKEPIEYLKNYLSHSALSKKDKSIITSEIIINSKGLKLKRAYCLTSLSEHGEFVLEYIEQQAKLLIANKQPLPDQYGWYAYEDAKEFAIQALHLINPEKYEKIMTRLSLA